VTNDTDMIGIIMYKKSVILFFMVLMIGQDIQGTRSRRKRKISEEKRGHFKRSKTTQNIESKQTADAAYHERLKSALIANDNQYVEGKTILTDVARKIIRQFKNVINEERVKNNQKRVRLTRLNDRDKRSWSSMCRRRLPPLYMKYCEMKKNPCAEIPTTENILKVMPVLLKNKIPTLLQSKPENQEKNMSGNRMRIDFILNSANASPEIGVGKISPEERVFVQAGELLDIV